MTTEPRPTPRRPPPAARRPRALILVLGALVVAVAAVAVVATRWGSDSSKPGATTGDASQLLSNADVTRWPAGSPERALYAWWRNTQYENLSGYLDFFVPSIRERLTSEGIAGRDLHILAAQLRPARPEIVDSETSSTHAVLYTTITFRQPVGSTRFRSYTVPQAFAMVRSGGAATGPWALTDYLFVSQLIQPTLDAQQNGR